MLRVHRISCAEGSHLGGEPNSICLKDPINFIIYILIYTEKYKVKIKPLVNLNNSIINFRMPMCNISWPENLIKVQCSIQILNENDVVLHTFTYNYVNYENKLIIEHTKNNKLNHGEYMEFLNKKLPNKEMYLDASISRNFSEINLKNTKNKAKEILNQMETYAALNNREPKKVIDDLRIYAESKFLIYD